MNLKIKMKVRMRILVFNFGSTSSKVAIFNDEKCEFEKTIRHDSDTLKRFALPQEQYELRKKIVIEEIEKAGYSFDSFDAICSRAGLLRPTPSGTYKINDRAIEDVKDIEIGGRQPHGLGIRLADEISKKYNIPAYFCDPVSTDELTDVARVSGMKGMERKSQFHALNQKAVAIKTAKAIGKPYEELNLIGVHLGGGTSVAAHCKGLCIDISDCSAEDAFALDRAGGLPVPQVVDWCFSGESKADIKMKLRREAGLYSYLGTTDFREVVKRVHDGDEEAKLIYDALVYQHVKAIGGLAAIMKFDIDAIFFTGGMAFDEEFINEFKKYIGKIAPIYIFPGEDEMMSLANGAIRVLKGETEVKEYR